MESLSTFFFYHFSKSHYPAAVEGVPVDCREASASYEQALKTEASVTVKGRDQIN